jgi:hypothetical protein
MSTRLLLSKFFLRGYVLFRKGTFTPGNYFKVTHSGKVLRRKFFIENFFRECFLQVTFFRERFTRGIISRKLITGTFSKEVFRKIVTKGILSRKVFTGSICQESFLQGNEVENSDRKQYKQVYRKHLCQFPINSTMSYYQAFWVQNIVERRGA